MTTHPNTLNTRKVLTVKKLLTLVVLATAMLVLVAVPAFAEGYNDGGYNYTSGLDESDYGDNAGLYVRNPVGDDQEYSWRGPHGSYSVSTNKCQDCHSTHYATGSFMLMRANSREQACDFCHTGGGGSSINIQMDNAYSMTGVEATTTSGFGTGHTLGYKGFAPADIKPAFQDASGFACFNCHSPHGNSERMIYYPAAPGAAVDEFSAALGATAPGNGVVEMVYYAHTTDPVSDEVLDLLRIDAPGSILDGYYDLNKLSVAQWNSLVLGAEGGVPADWMANFATDPYYDDYRYRAGGASMLGPFGGNKYFALWGHAPFARNTVFRRGYMHPLTMGNTDSSAITRPIFETGKWLLVKNPNVKRAEKTITVYDWERTSGTIYWEGAPLRGTVKTLNIGDEVPNTVVGFKFKLDGSVATSVNSHRTNMDNPATAPNRDPEKIYLEGAFTLAEINAALAVPGSNPVLDAAWRDISSDGVNKYAIDWDANLGPEDQSGGPEQESERQQAYPWIEQDITIRIPPGTPNANPMGYVRSGFGSQNEFCADCHSGTAGASTQKASVHLPIEGNYVDANYIDAYSHDAQPRH